MLFPGLALWWDPCSSVQVWLLALQEAQCEEDNLGGPQERTKSKEELKNLCCVQHSATLLGLWVTYRGNCNWWWRALVSVKLQCATRNNYLMLMLYECIPDLQHRLFPGEVIKTCSSSSACGSPPVSVLQSGTGLCPNHDLLLSDLVLWLVEWELKVGVQRALLPLSSPKN